MSEIPAPTDPPPRRLPSMDLPPYRYVPGLHPHPLKHPGGHRCAGNPPLEPWDSSRSLADDPVWLAGCDLFDQRYWWEAHELWEARWKQLPEDAPARALLQGCIQVAASLLRSHLGDENSARRLAERATDKLRAAQRAADEHGGVDIDHLVRGLQARLAGGPVPYLAPRP